MVTVLCCVGRVCFPDSVGVAMEEIWLRIGGIIAEGACGVMTHAWAGERGPACSVYKAKRTQADDYRIKYQLEESRDVSSKLSKSWGDSGIIPNLLTLPGLRPPYYKSPRRRFLA